MLESLADQWIAFKDVIENFLGLSSDAVHANAGTALFLFLALFVRRGRLLIVPWTILLVLELGNEWLDLSYSNWETSLESSVRDFFNTMTIPTVLMFLMKYRERPWGRKAESSGALEQAGGEALE